MTLRTSDIIPIDNYGDIIWDDLTPEERDAAWERMRDMQQAQEEKARRALLGVWVVLAAAAAIVLAGTAFAQDGLQSSRPQGFFGQGHEQFHEFYWGLKNSAGGSCCSGTDGRPTQGRWNAVTGTWDVMVDGQWRTLRSNQSYTVLTPEVLAAQGRERPDDQAHVFTSPDGRSLYCFIPPASGG